MTNEGPPIRIGTAERTAAMKALDEHLAAGRLQIEEYGTCPPRTRRFPGWPVRCPR